MIISSSVDFYRNQWQMFGYEMLSKHTNKNVFHEHFRLIKSPNHNISFKHSDILKPRICRSLRQYRVGILREEGSNGDKEMVFAFYNSCFVVTDINMRDIIKSRGEILKTLDGLVFVGGFSYADALGAGVIGLLVFYLMKI